MTLKISECKKKKKRLKRVQLVNCLALSASCLEATWVTPKIEVVVEEGRYGLCKGKV